MDGVDDDYIEIEPWPVREMVGHLVATATVARRGLMEISPSDDPFERETDRFELESWARLELSQWLTEAEYRLLEREVGTFTPELESEADEHLFAASTVAWALGIKGVGALPIESDGGVEEATVEWCPVPWTHVKGLERRAHLRPPEVLAAERERWEILLWRCELFTDPQSKPDDRAALNDALMELRDVAPGMISKAGDDLGLDNGSSFSSIGAGDLDVLGSVAMVRLRALNWVCGYGDSPLHAPLYLDDDAND